jgi:beta-N-acetylhexosaminidase
MMGFDGTSVTPQIRELIEKYHIGSILLTAKNLKSKKIALSAWHTTEWM